MPVAIMHVWCSDVGLFTLALNVRRFCLLKTFSLSPIRNGFIDMNYIMVYNMDTIYCVQEQERRNKMKLKEARKQKKLSMMALAAKSGVSYPTVFRAEHGEPILRPMKRALEQTLD